MKIEVSDNHSVAVGLLTKGPVLDAGCRGFEFATWFAEREHIVLALDPDDSVDPYPAYDAWAEDFPTDIIWLPQALEARNGRMYLVLTEDPEARFMTHAPVKGPYKSVETVTIGSLMANRSVNHWDVVKLNIEGSEIDVLGAWPGPIARQIVVSFHLHTNRQTEADVERAVKHISQWYTPIQHVKDERYCAGANYWDSLFVLKELA